MNGKTNMNQYNDLIALANGGFFYLASPYTDPDEAVRNRRAELSNEYAGHLLRHGVFTYQAIWSTHAIAERHALPVPHEHWIALNKAFIDPSAGIIVCDIPGWITSRGIAHEIKYARSIGKPLFICGQWRNYQVSELEWWR